MPQHRWTSSLPRRAALCPGPVSLPGVGPPLAIEGAWIALFGTAAFVVCVHVFQCSQTLAQSIDG